MSHMQGGHSSKLTSMLQLHLRRYSSRGLWQQRHLLCQSPMLISGKCSWVARSSRLIDRAGMRLACICLQSECRAHGFSWGL